LKTYLPLLAATVALGFQAPAQSAAPTTKDATVVHVLYPAKKIIGLNLRNDSQKNLGEIGDLLVDPNTGEIRYAVLEVGGFLGVGEDKRVVPWSFIQIVPDEKDADKGHARAALTEDQVKAAPKAKSGQKFDVELDRRIEATFGKNDAWVYAGKGQPAFAWASQMDGATLKDPSSKDIGTVKELIVAPANSCVAYLVVDTNKEAGDKDVALPFSKANFLLDKNDQLVARTTVEPAKFVAAPEYDSKDWKRMSSTAYVTELGTYYGSDPFWKTARFAGAKKKSAGE
jgi:sporulation protein YlmC with PRC-barrel domain